MKIKIAILLRLIYRFGFLAGIKLFFHLEIMKTELVNVPGISEPITLRKNSTDVYTFYQLFLYDSYDISVENPEFIIDGGANIGLFTIMMKNKFPLSTIVCIEPDPENLKILEKNVSNYKNVYIEKGGLWSKDTTLKVFDKFKNGEWGFVVEEDLEQGNIQSISINRILEKYRKDKIDILKIDIETSEKQLFSENYQNWLNKTYFIAIELHDSLEPNCSKTFFRALDQCFDSYNLYLCGENIMIKRAS